jgi:PAS domain S-box-containing protein
MKGAMYGAKFSASPTELGKFLREHRTAIAREWERSARALAPAEALPHARLLDGVPRLLERVGALLESGAETAGRADLERVRQHAWERLEEGFGLADVLAEITLLRQAVAELWGQERANGGAGAGSVAALDRIFDRFLVATAREYGEVQTRVLAAMDRITAASLDSTALEQLLEELAAAIVEELPSVDTVTVLMVEDDELRVRAAVGPEEGTPSDPSMLECCRRVAERVVAEGRPLDLSSLPHAPDGRPELRPLYGVPIRPSGEPIIGVAAAGSTTARALSGQDRRLLESMVSRATAAIHQHRFREAAERRAAQLADSESKQQRTEARLRMAVQVVGLETWEWDVATGEIECTPRCRRTLGLDPEQALDMRTLLSLVPGAERHGFVEALRDAMDPARDGLFARDQRIVRPSDGEQRWLATRAKVVFEEGERAPERVLGTFLDVTERKTAQEQAQFLADASRLLASSLDYEVTLAHVAEAAVPRIADTCAVDIVEPDGTLGELVAVAGRHAGEVRRVKAMRRERTASSRPSTGVEQVLRTGRPELVPRVEDEHLRALTSDPEMLAFLRGLELDSWLIVPLESRGEVFGAVTLVYTGSGRRFAPEDVPFAQELAARASAAIENARLHEETARGVEVRDRMISLLSHDLRTPLAAIDLGSTLLLEGETLAEDTMARRQAEIIRRNAGRITHLVNDLLDLLHIQTGKLALKMRSCDGAQILHHAVESQRATAEERGVRLRFDEGASGARVRCDRARLREALSRTVGHAIEQAERRSVVHVRSTVEGSALVITVRDAGVDPEELEAVFELYWRGKAAQERSAGLALFIARGIVRAHCGRLRVEERPGGESAFVIALPLLDESPFADEGRERPQALGPKRQRSG